RSLCRFRSSVGKRDLSARDSGTLRVGHYSGYTTFLTLSRGGHSGEKHDESRTKNQPQQNRKSLHWLDPPCLSNRKKAGPWTLSETGWRPKFCSIVEKPVARRSPSETIAKCLIR